MEPVLKKVAEFTGMEAITLVGVRWNEERETYEARAVNYGTIDGPVPKDFLSWNPDAFKRVFCGQITMFAKEVRSKSLLPTYTTRAVSQLSLQSLS